IAANLIVRKKIQAAIRDLPPSIRVTYKNLHPDIWTGSLVIDSLEIQHISMGQVSIHGISFLALARSKTPSEEQIEKIRIQIHNITYTIPGAYAKLHM